MYQSPRGLKKLNVIDEGWKLLDFKNEKVGQFIEKGYRTRVDIPAHTSPSRKISWTSTPRPHRALHALPGGTRRTRPF